MAGRNVAVTDTSPHLEWVAGRVGMLYRDITPDGLDGRVVVSQIRLPFSGQVPDYVHYHLVEFQLIYCLKGRIKVVYEDQGEPFWMEPGDCVLQPPEIRHCVLECEVNSEVIEVTMPAEHETRADKEMTLPTTNIKPDRLFGAQRFIHLRGSGSVVERLSEIRAQLPEDPVIDATIGQVIRALG